MKKVYLVWSGVAETEEYDYVEEVFSNKQEAEKYKNFQNEYWNEIWITGQSKTHWIFWVKEEQVRTKAILKGSQK